MDDKCFRLLKASFFVAFPGNQKAIFPTLRSTYKLDFRGRSYADAWDELTGKYGPDALAAIVIQETTQRIGADGLDKLRNLFWSDTLPPIDTLRSLDPTNYRAWGDTLSGFVDGAYIERTEQWSVLASLWFQYLDTEHPNQDTQNPVLPAPPGPRNCNAYAEGLGDPAPLFKQWIEWKGARPVSNSTSVANIVMGETGKKIYILKHWEGSLLHCHPPV